jgi:hypothetical protein
MQRCSSAQFNHHAMETYGGGGIAPPFLTSALDGGEYLASRSGRFTPMGKSPVTHCIGWVPSSAGMDSVEKRKFS